MPFVPFALPFTFLAGLLSLAILGGGVYLLWAWFAGVVVGTGFLIASLAMITLTFTGRFLVLLLRRPGDDEPRPVRATEVQRIVRPNGSELHVELYGPPNAPPIVLTHGWGMNARVWYYAKRQLADRFRVIVWDLPGLGESRKSDDNFELETLARDLDAVLSLAGNQRAILLGHSIGGMITLTWCRLFPDKLRDKVAGLILANTSYTNPIHTSSGRAVLRILQKPLIEPMLHVVLWLSPLVWLMTWLSYWNGSSHIVSMLVGFAGSETRGQLEFATRFGPHASPAVQARGVLAMLRYDATAVLRSIAVPVLVVTGHLDRLTIPEASRLISTTVPRGALFTLDPAGHASLLEQHEGFVEIVTDFAIRHAVPVGAPGDSARNGRASHSAA